MDQEAEFKQHWMGVFPDLFTKNEMEAAKTPKKPARKPAEDIKIVAIDLQPISPLPGVTTLKADITHPSTIPLLLKALDPDYDPHSGNPQASHPVDLVISDGAPDVTGLHDLDIYVQSQLLLAALNLALCVLKPGGKFVAKIFRGKDVHLLHSQMKIFFESVSVAKPRSSRASSIEAFVVCRNFHMPKGFKPSLMEPLGAGRRLATMAVERARRRPISARTILQRWSAGSWDVEYQPVWPMITSDGIIEMEFEDHTSKGEAEKEEEQDVSWIAPFIACGDLSAFDSDASYALPQDHVPLDPVQPPTAPPYKKALEMRKAASGAYGKTGPKG